ncbi:MAG: hypothetical protein ACQESR_07315 [Planctomycetota bacterium]
MNCFLRAMATIFGLVVVTHCARGQGMPRQPSPDSTFGVEEPGFLPSPAPRVRLPEENWHAGSSGSHLPPPPGWSTSQFASFGGESGRSPESEPLLSSDELAMETGRVSSHKSGFFQKLAINSNWIHRGGGNNWGLIENELFLTVALPLPSRDFPLMITSGFDTVLLNGPSTPDLPPRLYDGYVDFMWLPKLSERWLGILSVAPGVYSDFDSVQDDAFRVKAKALARVDLVPERVQVLFGILYLDRDDVNWLPAGGVIWDPNDDIHLELVFPQPQFAYRLTSSGLFEDWCYLAGEFGGDTWSIRRGVDEFDMVTYVDWRLFLGLERRRPGGAAQRVEVGYVFGREIKFDSPSPDALADDTFMVRAGVDF